MGASLGNDDVVDGNDPIANGTGTHKGENGSSILVDSTKSFGSLTTGRAVYAGLNPAFFIFDLTSGASGRISANTGTTVKAALSGGTRSVWNTGDAYKISGGYWARDGIGRSTDTHKGSSGDWPDQALDPAYVWGNTWNGNTTGVLVHNNSGFWCQAGRDFFVNTGAKPGYAPYEYPHPLTKTTSQSPKAPANLRLTSN